MLSGWGGPNDRYDPLLEHLAAMGYRVLLPDLPGPPGKTSPVYLRPEAWGAWVEELTTTVVRGPFVLVCHSLSARIAFQFLMQRSSACHGAVFIEPWLLSSPLRAFLWRTVARLVRRLCPLVYPDMKWVGEGEAWASALGLMSAVRKLEGVPCLTLFGNGDPAKCLFNGWRRIGGEVRTYNWGHSPQITATARLATIIDEFVQSNLQQPRDP